MTSFSVDYPRMAFIHNENNVCLLHLESEEETTEPHDSELVEVLLAFPLVLTIDIDDDVAVHNVVTSQVVGRTRLDHSSGPVSTNGKVVLVGGCYSYTLLGLPGENGEEEMWSRRSDHEDMKEVQLLLVFRH